MNVIYGIEISPKADRYIEIAEKALEGMAKAAAPGAFLVDVFPCCECCSRARWYPTDYNATVKYIPAWVPGAGFQKKAANWKNYVMEMRDAPFTAVQKALVSVANLVRAKLTPRKDAGTASPCFVTHLMNDLNNGKDDAEEQVEIIRGCAGLAYAGKT